MLSSSVGGFVFGKFTEPCSVKSGLCKLANANQFWEEAVYKTKDLLLVSTVLYCNGLQLLPHIKDLEIQSNKQLKKTIFTVETGKTFGRILIKLKHKCRHQTFPLNQAYALKGLKQNIPNLRSLSIFQLLYLNKTHHIPHKYLDVSHQSFAVPANKPWTSSRLYPLSKSKQRHVPSHFYGDWTSQEQLVNP